MTELEKLFKIPQERSPQVFYHYYATIYDHRKQNDPNFVHRTFEDQFKDYLNNYWLKYHQDNDAKLRIMLAEVSKCKVSELPSNLLPETKTKFPGLFHNRIPLEIPQFKYYYNIIFDPYFQMIKTALINIDPLFSSLSNDFTKAMIVQHLEDYQNNFNLIKMKYKEVPSFYETILYFGFNILANNQNKMFVDINNEEQKIILSHIYLNYSNKVA